MSDVQLPILNISYTKMEPVYKKHVYSYGRANHVSCIILLALNLFRTIFCIRKQTL